jgi:hypothetical protein
VKPGGGKEKGREFERSICKLLSLWVTNGAKKDAFWVSAMSGGRATVAYKVTGKTLRHQSGDVSAIAPEGHKLLDVFSIEMKSYKTLALEQLFYVGNKGQDGIIGFWQQTCTDAARAGKLPMLIAKQNHKPPLLGVTPDMFEALGLEEKAVGFGTVYRFDITPLILVDLKDLIETPYAQIQTRLPIIRKRPNHD